MSPQERLELAKQLLDDFNPHSISETDRQKASVATALLLAVLVERMLDDGPEVTE